MKVQLEALPSHKQKRIVHLQRWMESLSEDEKAAAQAERKAARARAQARKHTRQEKLQTFNAMVLSGATLDEISAALRMTPAGVRMLADTWGFTVSQRPGHRRAPQFWLSQATATALRRLAEDRGKTIPETLETLVAYLGEDDAHVARRLFHVKPRTTKVEG